MSIVAMTVKDGTKNTTQRNSKVKTMQERTNAGQDVFFKKLLLEKQFDSVCPELGGWVKTNFHFDTLKNMTIVDEQQQRKGCLVVEKVMTIKREKTPQVNSKKKKRKINRR